MLANTPLHHVVRNELPEQGSGWRRKGGCFSWRHHGDFVSRDFLGPREAKKHHVSITTAPTGINHEPKDIKQARHSPKTSPTAPETSPGQSSPKPGWQSPTGQEPSLVGGGSPRRRAAAGDAWPPKSRHTGKKASGEKKASEGGIEEGIGGRHRRRHRREASKKASEGGKTQGPHPALSPKPSALNPKP